MRFSVPEAASFRPFRRWALENDPWPNYPQSSWHKGRRGVISCQLGPAIAGARVTRMAYPDRHPRKRSANAGTQANRSSRAVGLGSRLAGE